MVEFAHIAFLSWKFRVKGPAQTYLKGVFGVYAMANALLWSCTRFSFI